VTKKTFLHLDSPVQYIKGIGPKRSLYFRKVGVETVKDLIYFVPRRYIDYSTILRICDTRINDEATVTGRVDLVEARRVDPRRDLCQAARAADRLRATEQVRELDGLQRRKLLLDRPQPFPVEQVRQHRSRDGL